MLFRSSTGVAADTAYHTFRLEVSASGDVDAFIDDVRTNHIQYVAATTGLKPSIKYTPYFCTMNTTTTAAVMDIDYYIVAHQDA